MLLLFLWFEADSIFSMNFLWPNINFKRCGNTYIYSTVFRLQMEFIHFVKVSECDCLLRFTIVIQLVFFINICISDFTHFFLIFRRFQPQSLFLLSLFSLKKRRNTCSLYQYHNFGHTSCAVTEHSLAGTTQRF